MPSTSARVILLSGALAALGVGGLLLLLATGLPASRALHPWLLELVERVGVGREVVPSHVQLGGQSLVVPSAAPPGAVPEAVERPAPPDTRAGPDSMGDDDTAWSAGEPPEPPADHVAFDPPITRVRAPRIGLDSAVVPAPLVRIGADTTWDVPAFSVGHAALTAGAGAAGNAVLLGHVTSLNAGAVFADLHRLRAGDVLEISGGERQFAYTVVEVRRVPRTDLSVLQPTEDAAVSLITCTGAWLPALEDYAERLVVRAQLGSGPTG